MKLLAFVCILALSITTLAHEEISPLQLSQATLESLKSLIRKEKITADKIQITNINPEYIDSSTNEELLEITMSYVNTAGANKQARFLCHAVDHLVTESAIPHCHRSE